MSAHTPGPWAHHRYGTEAISPNVVVLEDDGACGDPECCGPASYTIEIKPQDASLIVAAPDLLAALKAYHEFFGDRYINTGAEFQAIRIEAINAISKAIGAA